MCAITWGSRLLNIPTTPPPPQMGLSCITCLPLMQYFLSGSVRIRPHSCKLTGLNTGEKFVQKII